MSPSGVDQLHRNIKREPTFGYGRVCTCCKKSRATPGGRSFAIAGSRRREWYCKECAAARAEP